MDNAFLNIIGYDSPPYKNSNLNFKDAFKILNNFNRDYFFVMAHVDNDNGLFKENKGRNLENIICSEEFREKVLALQKSRFRDNLEKVSGIALVEGTDNALGGIETIGLGNEQDGITRKSYIKLGDYNFPALKYALRNSKNRTSLSSNNITNAYIESISFNGGKFDGETIDFSPEMNCLIGIRGSGKSSLIEILRYALGISLSNATVDNKYKNELIDFVLGSGGKVTLKLLGSDGQHYRVEKIYNEKEFIYREDNTIVDASLDSILGPKLYFGQKDLSNQRESFELDLIQQLTGNSLVDIKRKINAKKEEIKRTIFELQSNSNLNEEKEALKQTISDLNNQLLYFEKQGISKKLERQTGFDKDAALLGQTKDILTSYFSDLQNLLDEYISLSDLTLSGSEQNSSIFEEASTILASIKSTFASLNKVLLIGRKNLEEFDKLILKLESIREGMSEEFARIKRELNSDSISPDYFLELRRNFEVANLKYNEIEKLENKNTALINSLNTQLAELNILWEQEYISISEKVSQINNEQNHLLIQIIKKGDKEGFLAKLRTTFKGTGIQDTTYKKIENSFEDFIDIYNKMSDIKDLLTERQYSEFYAYFKENITDLLTFHVNNRVNIFYNDKPLKQLSLGQRASALILFLLTQKNNNILIIDQPEDDLDNQTIYNEVIKQLIKLKGSMQFIFATHNANIPVLGDSEKVMAFSFDNDKINAISGTIDSPDIHNLIVNIMEGGRDAFNRRNEIYKEWK